MAVKKEIILTSEFQQPLETVFGYFLDLHKFGEVHPLMTSVEVVSDKSPEFIEYHITEKTLLFGFIPMKPEYNAKVFEVEKNRKIRYLSQVKKNVALDINFTFEFDSTGKKTLITEHIEVCSNSFVASMFISILKKNHLAVFQNLQQK